MPAAIGCVVLGIGLPIFFGSIANIALTPVIVADVAEDALGRTIAALHVFGGAAGLLGALMGGALGDWIGVRPSIWALSTVALVAVAVCLPAAIRVARRDHGDHSGPGPTPEAPSGTVEGITVTDEYAHQRRH
jgi:MFS family permease